MKPIFFATQADLRKWFDKNHKTASQLLLGYYKVGSRKPSVTWDQSVDEALCFGWIDGIRRGLDAQSYTIRFTPRRADSFWSKKNIASVGRLIKEGRMKPAGLTAFQVRKGERSGAYSFEQDEIAPFSAALKRRFKANKAAWNFFGTQPPGYQKTMRHWVISAKGEATQIKRLDRIIEVSAKKKRVDLMSPFKMTQDQRK